MKKLHLVEKLHRLSLNRKKEEEAFLNFISNTYRYRDFVRQFIADARWNEQIEIIISQYIVSLVSIWETFFRDIFVFVVKKNPNLVDEIKKRKPKKIKGLVAVPPQLIEEFVATIFNFQNLDSIQEALAVVLGDKNVPKRIAEEKALIAVPRKGVTSIKLDQLFPDWRNDIDRIIAERHRIIHDANHRCIVTRKEISRWETELFLYLQLLGLFISRKFQLPWIKFNTEIIAFEVSPETSAKKKAMLLTIDDLLSNDYELLN